MTDFVLWLVLVVVIVNAALVILALWRASGTPQLTLQILRDELRSGREEARNAARELRDEVSANLKNLGDMLMRTIESFTQHQNTRLATMSDQLRELVQGNQASLDRIQKTLDARLNDVLMSNERKIAEIRQEVAVGLKTASEAVSARLQEMSGNQHNQLQLMNNQLKELTETNQSGLERVRATLDARLKDLQDANERRLADIRQQVAESLKAASETIAGRLQDMATSQQNQLQLMTHQLKSLSDANQSSLENVRATLDSRLKELQEGNERKLEEMRRTVDEKLHQTLETRLGESFRLVSDRLEAVHKGLGEVQSLANSVSDLRRVLTNVKTRGTWAEVQLGALLEEIFTPEQYSRNVAVRPESAEVVEYAIRLPGSRNDFSAPVWLPIDAKFPQEDYLRAQEAEERGDVEGYRKAIEALKERVRMEAKRIQEKYVCPPHTTDFAIMFLPTEGLYGEILRQPGLVDELLRTYRVVVAGPTTLGAILSSLRMGFQTLAIERRAAEVWRVLGAVKTEFRNFADVLRKVKRHLQHASSAIDRTDQRRRVMEQRLQDVEQLPSDEAVSLLQLSVQEDLESDEPLADDSE
ncbi:MAG: DNA recombination protein RmuC [Gemmatales bacterium]|nr:DNA recombination protein RmuC [Gemmatales bacterium]MDW7995390.1 DNA recombination protein RmuC [Gemmatales bacterium]MDW8223389.1 DNA recombination protein RmuC [Gemmatales bacterium]